MTNDDAMKRVVLMDADTSREIAEWASGFDVPPCFACGSTSQGVAQCTINIRHSEVRGTYAFLNVMCKVCDGQAQANMGVKTATTGESVIDTFHRAMGIDPTPPDPSKMS